MSRRAGWNGTEIKITKRLILGSQAGFDVEYAVENRGGSKVNAFFAVEMNYNLLAGDAHDRYYFNPKSDNAGKLATIADFGTLSSVGLKDHWLNVALTLRTSEPARVIVSPVKTVSQSEGGLLSASRGHLLDDLRDGRSLRRAFVLREVLGPPVGLR